MATRYERRKARAELKRKLANPKVRAIATRELVTGKGTEFYEMRLEGSAGRLLFDVSGLRAWAELHAEKRIAPPDWDRFDRLMDNDAVSIERIMQHTLLTDPEPIIICKDLDGGDQIVDGSHRFAAMCMAVRLLGAPEDRPIGLPALIVEKEDWESFLIDEATAATLGYRSPFD